MKSANNSTTLNSYPLFFPPLIICTRSSLFTEATYSKANIQPITISIHIFSKVVQLPSRCDNVINSLLVQSQTLYMYSTVFTVPYFRPRCWPASSCSSSALGSSITGLCARSAGAVKLDVAPSGGASRAGEFIISSRDGIGRLTW